MLDYLKLRWSLKPYIEKLMKEAHEDGSPLMRTMFYEFPDDAKCWEVTDQYMFGDKYLVAPILEAGMSERKRISSGRQVGEHPRPQNLRRL